jgi:transposase
MKRERKPSRRLRMHIALLASDSLSPTEIARVLFCSRTTVYAVASRFSREGRAVFDDRRRRGPKPLIGKEEGERVERLIEEDSPVEHGWLRSRWSCKLLSLQLMSERLAEASRESVRRVLHRLGYRWRRPRPVGPDKDSSEHIEEKRERLGDVRKMTEEKAAVGSTGRCNTVGFRCCPDRGCVGGEVGSSGRVVRGAQEGAVGEVEGRGVHQRHLKGTKEAPRLHPRDAQGHRRDRPAPAAQAKMRAHFGRAGGDLPRARYRGFSSHDRRPAGPVCLYCMPGSKP